MAYGLPLPADFDATDQLDEVRVGTSNLAALLRAGVSAGEAGVRALLDQIEPYAEWLDGVLGRPDQPEPAAAAPAAPAGLPVDRVVNESEAARTLGV